MTGAILLQGPCPASCKICLDLTHLSGIKQVGSFGLKPMDSAGFADKADAGHQPGPEALPAAAGTSRGVEFVKLSCSSHNLLRLFKH